MRIGLGLLLHLLEGGQADHRAGIPDAGAFVRGIEVVGVGLGPLLGDFGFDEGNAADVVETGDIGTAGEPMGDFDDGTLGIAVDQKIGLGVEQDRAPHLVRPVVVMGDPAQRALDAADHDRRRRG